MLWVDMCRFLRWMWGIVETDVGCNEVSVISRFSVAEGSSLDDNLSYLPNHPSLYVYIRLIFNSNVKKLHK